MVVVLVLLLSLLCVYSDYVNQPAIEISTSCSTSRTKDENVGIRFEKGKRHFHTFEIERFSFGIAKCVGLEKIESELSTNGDFTAHSGTSTCDKSRVWLQLQLAIIWLFTLFGDRIVRVLWPLARSIANTLKPMAKISGLRLRHTHSMNPMKMMFLYTIFPRQMCTVYTHKNEKTLQTCTRNAS